MTSSRSIGRSVAILTFAVLVLAGCPADDDPAADLPPLGNETTPTSPGEEPPPDPSPGDDPRPVQTLETLAAACADTGSGNEAGSVVLQGDLQASNTAVEIPDCVILLESGVNIDLVDLAITGGDVVIHDRASEPGTNLINLERVSIELQSLTIELSDPDDALRTQNMNITTSRGIDLQIDGRRDGRNQGGTIHLIETSLNATDNDAPVRLVASDDAGTIRLERSSIDTTGPITVRAWECAADLGDGNIDCSTDAGGDPFG